MDARISVRSGDVAQETADLAEWLRHDRDLPTLVDVLPRPVAPGHLGAAVDVVVALAGSGGVAVPLCSSLRAWLKAKVPKVSIEVETDEGHIKVDARNMHDEKTWDQLLQFLLSASRDRGGAGDG